MRPSTRVSITSKGRNAKRVISLQSAIARVSPCNNADFDDELVHLCNLPVQRDEPVTARSEKGLRVVLVHLCNHAPLPVPLSLQEAVLLLVDRMTLPVVPPVRSVPFAPCSLGRSLVLAVVGIACELFFLPALLPGPLAVGASAVPLLLNSGMGNKLSLAVGTPLLHVTPSAITSVGKSVQQKSCAGKEDGCYREDRGFNCTGVSGWVSKPMFLRWVKNRPNGSLQRREVGPVFAGVSISHDHPVTGPRVFFQGTDVLHDRGAHTQWVEVYVADKLQEIGILFAEYGLIAVLKEMACPSVPSIEVLGIAGQQAAHDRGKGDSTGLQQKVAMVGEKRPGVTRRAGIVKNCAETFEKGLVVSSVSEYGLSFYSPEDDMVH